MNPAPLLTALEYNRGDLAARSAIGGPIRSSLNNHCGFHCADFAACFSRAALFNIIDPGFCSDAFPAAGELIGNVLMTGCKNESMFRSDGNLSRYRHKRNSERLSNSRSNDESIRGIFITDKNSLNYIAARSPVDKRIGIDGSYTGDSWRYFCRPIRGEFIQTNRTTLIVVNRPSNLISIKPQWPVRRIVPLGKKYSATQRQDFYRNHP